MTVNYNIFQEESYLRATYKLVSCEKHAFLIILINEDDLEHGVRIISFDKKEKTKLSKNKVRVEIRNRKYLFDPIAKKLMSA